MATIDIDQDEFIFDEKKVMKEEDDFIFDFKDVMQHQVLLVAKASLCRTFVSQLVSLSVAIISKVI